MAYEAMNKSSTVYIAGHTGLIGSALVRILKKEGFENIITAPHKNLDLTDFKAVESFLSRSSPQYVILTAGRVGGIIENQNYPADLLSTNLIIQLNVIRASFYSDVRRVILFGSSCMYPRQTSQPMAESALLTGVPEPSSISYAVSKLAGVHLCLAYNQQYGTQRFLPIIPNSVYGPNDNFDPDSGHVLAALIRRVHSAHVLGLQRITLWGTGKPRREFIYADDVARACLLLLSQDTDQIEFPLNLGVGYDYSIKDLAKLVAKVVGYQGHFEWDETRPDGAPRKLLDSSRIKNLGWQPCTTLSDGLRETYRWFLQNHSEDHESSGSPSQR
jgi:GDP-L-fucose synthase